MTDNEWRKLDVNNLPRDILTGEYEFYFFEDGLWEDAGMCVTDILSDAVNGFNFVYRKKEVQTINHCVNCYLAFTGKRKACPFCSKDPDVKVPSHEEIMKYWWDFDTNTNSALKRGWLKVLYYKDGLYYTADPIDHDYVGWSKRRFIGRDFAHVPPEVDDGQ